MPASLSVAAYACAVIAVGIAAVEGTRRLAAAVLNELAAPPAPATREASRPTSRLVASSPVPTVRREAIMTPLQDRWSGQSRPGWRVIAGPQFGGSSLVLGVAPGVSVTAIRRSLRPRPVPIAPCACACATATHSPINFAVTRDKLQRDSGVCASRCGAQGRLFVHRNPGGSVEDMEDLSGRPYRQLRTAFLYRTELVA